MPLVDYSMIRDGQAARREKALPFSLTKVAAVNGTAGKVSAGGSWIGLACVLANPATPASSSVVLDVWLNGIDTSGPADVSIPLGEKATVPFQSFAYAVRVVGVPPIDFLMILAGYDVGQSEEIPRYERFLLGAGGGVSSSIVSPLVPAPVGGGVLIGPIVPASVVELVSAPTVAPGVLVVAGNAANIGGIVQNLSPTLSLGLSLDPGAAFAACAIRLNPAPAADGGGSTIDLSAFPWALGQDVYGVVPLGGPGAAGSWSFRGT